MKKIIMMLLAMLIAMPMTLIAETATEKRIERATKNKMKEMKKEHWKVFGSSLDLEDVLVRHYEKLFSKGDDAYEVMGTATAKSKNILRLSALTNACAYYAAQAGSSLKGRMVSSVFGDESNMDAEFSRFYAAYESNVEKEIKGELRESFSVIRELGDGVFEVQTFFLVDEDAATAARIRALESAIRESELAQDYADTVSDFVREGFNKHE